jgi:hypothetical protein
MLHGTVWLLRSGKNRPPTPGLRITSDLPRGPSGRPLRAGRPVVPPRPRTEVVPCSSPRVGPPGPGRFSLRLRVAQQALRFASGLWLAPKFVLASAVLRLRLRPVAQTLGSR